MPNEKYLKRTLDWKSLFEKKTLAQAMDLLKYKKNDSLFPQSETLCTAQIYDPVKGFMTLTCSNAPTHYTDSWSQAYFKCSCQKRSYYYGIRHCAHMAAMLYLWEEQHGPWEFTENEEEHDERITAELREEEVQRRRQQMEAEGTINAALVDILPDEDPHAEPPYFDLRHILRIKKVSLYEINRARLILDNSGVSDIRHTLDYDRSGNCQIQAFSNVNDGLDSHDVSATMTADNLVSCQCGCPRMPSYGHITIYSVNNKICEHLTAFFAKLDGYLCKNNPGNVTNKAMALFLKSFDSFSDIKDSAESAPADERAKRVVIEPLLNVDGSSIILSYRVGRQGEKLLILKNLSDFLDAYDTGTSISISKKVTIDFSVEDITEASEKWLTNIRRKVNEVASINNKLQAKSPWSYVSTLSLKSREALSGSDLDNFYSLTEGSLVDCKNKNNATSYPIKVGHKPLRMTLTSSAVRNSAGSTIGMAISGTFPMILEGSIGDYVFSEKNLSRLSQEEKSLILPFAKTAGQSGKINLRVGKNEIAEFYYRALPRIMQNPCIVYDDQTGGSLDSLLPPEGEYSFRLDREDDEILCLAKASYEDRSYKIGEQDSKTDGYRDLRQEDRIIDVLEKYFWHNTDNGLYQMPTDDDTIYELLTEAVPALSRFGEVRGDSSFRLDQLRSVPDMTVGVSVESDLMDISIISKDITPKELLDIFDSYKLKKKYYKLSNGDFIALEHAEGFRELEKLSGELGLDIEEMLSGNITLPIYRALYLDKLLEEHDALAANRNRTFRSLVKNFSTIKDSDYEVPEGLSQVLRKYQEYGYKWLRTLCQASFGGILADEMGLGKTVQIISVIKALKDEGVSLAESVSGNAMPSLIVCPASLVYNWQEEFARFAPDVSTKVIAGGIGNRRSLFGEIKAALKGSGSGADNDSDVKNNNAKNGSDVKSGSGRDGGKEGSGRDGSKDGSEDGSEDGSRDGSNGSNSPVRNVSRADVYITSYDLLRRDAASYKDLSFNIMVIDEAQYIKNPKASQTKAVKSVKASRRFALTGTPIENKLSELWSIFDYLMPGFLYTYHDFQGRFENAIAKNKDAELTARLKKMISPFILRRLKTDVLKDLPEKLEEVRYARFDDEQRKLYDAQVVRMKRLIKDESLGSGGRDKIQILAELTRIRQICCDPSLVFEGYNGGSAKLDACIELIESAIEGGHRMLLFSQFKSMLHIIEDALKERGIDYFMITGETSKEKRLALVHEFNEGDIPVFLISLKAGGTGLNLTGADVVIHYDPWWNLAVQNQATDRAHRIGQKNKVTVYKLISKDTIEEKIINLQEAKKDLADAILSGEQSSLMSLSPQELLELLE